jgi:hypothetical protein
MVHCLDLGVVVGQQPVVLCLHGLFQRDHLFLNQVAPGPASLSIHLGMVSLILSFLHLHVQCTLGLGVGVDKVGGCQLL